MLKSIKPKAPSISIIKEERVQKAQAGMVTRAAEEREYDPEMIFKDKYNTPLSDIERVEFKKWTEAESERQGRDIMMDKGTYDVQGYWKFDQQLDKDGHGSDKWKKPNHPKFSDESIYNGADGFEGGKWVGDGFRPSKHTIELYGVDGLKARFDSEPHRPEFLDLLGNTEVKKFQKSGKFDKVQDNTSINSPHIKTLDKEKLAYLQKYGENAAYYKDFPEPQTVQQDNRPEAVRDRDIAAARKYEKVGATMQKPLMYLEDPFKILGDLGFKWAPNTDEDVERVRRAKAGIGSETLWDIAKEKVPAATFNAALAVVGGGGSKAMLNNAFNPLAGVDDLIKGGVNAGTKAFGKEAVQEAPASLHAIQDGVSRTVNAPAGLGLPSGQRANTVTRVQTMDGLYTGKDGMIYRSPAAYEFDPKYAPGEMVNRNTTHFSQNPMKESAGGDWGHTDIGISMPIDDVHSSNRLLNLEPSDTYFYSGKEGFGFPKTSRIVTTNAKANDMFRKQGYSVDFLDGGTNTEMNKRLAEINNPSRITNEEFIARNTADNVLYPVHTFDTATKAHANSVFGAMEDAGSRGIYGESLKQEAAQLVKKYKGATANETTANIRKAVQNGELEYSQASELLSYGPDVTRNELRKLNMADSDIDNIFKGKPSVQSDAQGLGAPSDIFTDMPQSFKDKFDAAEAIKFGKADMVDPETIRRMDELGIDTKKFSEKLAKTDFSTTTGKGSSMDGGLNTMNIDPADFATQYINDFSPNDIAAHEFGHMMQSEKVWKKPYANNIGEKDGAYLKIIKGVMPKAYPAAVKQFANVSTRPTSPTMIDTMLGNLTRRKDLNPPVTDLNRDAVTNLFYFKNALNKYGTAVDNSVERLPMFREYRQSMRDNGVLKNKWDDITPEHIDQFAKIAPKNRLNTFMDMTPENKALINRVSKIAPAVLGGALLSKQYNRKKGGILYKK